MNCVFNVCPHSYNTFMLHSLAMGTFQAGDMVPKVQAVQVGQRIAIHCFSNNNPSWKYSYTLGYRNKIANTCKTQIGHIYILHQGIFIRKSRSIHSGIYCCTGSLNNGTQFHNFAHVFVGGKINPQCVVKLSLKN